MTLAPRMLTQLTAPLKLHEGRLFLSCFGHRVPTDLIAEIVVHGVATNTATAGFASMADEPSPVIVAFEHWDASPDPEGDWTTVRTTELCVDTSGSIEAFSPREGVTDEAIEFPTPRGYYQVQAAIGLDEHGHQTWRIRLWDSPEFGPDLEEIGRIAQLAR